MEPCLLYFGKVRCSRLPKKEFAMDLDSYFRFMKWTGFICFCIIFPPLLFILLVALVMVMMGGK